ncbi:fimbria/pilus periplasmic chaperone [Citrobacter portucalensis]|uniref:fimbrial biogenesis chaperone n=1 Tax=Citrobacter portucalensis TaxID=1639133 RepID=UPI00339CDCD5
MMNLNISGLLFSAIFILFQNAASAGVQISNTRIIYPGDVDEVQATVKNTGNGNQLVQAWVDNFDKNDKSKPPR